MRIDELFDVTYGNKFDFNKMTIDPGGVAFVGRSGLRQGVSGRVRQVTGVAPYEAGLITVALGGASRLATFVQQAPFYTAQNVAVLRPRIQMTLNEKLYWAMCIKANRFRYEGFGREANRTLSSIELPDSVPPWAAKEVVPSTAGLSAPVSEKQSLLPNVEKWRNFRLDQLFDIKKGSRLTKATRQAGTTRFIGASDKNNGITDLVSGTPKFPAGCLTVAYNGNSVGWTFYQDQPFLASDDVNVLIPRDSPSKLALLFIAAVIRHGKSRYSYGYKWNLERMVSSTVRVPVNEDGKPDWVAMEQYMKGLAFSFIASQ